MKVAGCGYDHVPGTCDPTEHATATRLAAANSCMSPCLGALSNREGSRRGAPRAKQLRYHEANSGAGNISGWCPHGLPLNKKCIESGWCLRGLPQHKKCISGGWCLRGLPLNLIKPNICELGKDRNKRGSTLHHTLYSCPTTNLEVEHTFQS